MTEHLNADNDNRDAELEAKIFEAIRIQNDIDYHEAGPKAPASSIIYKGVNVASRWGVLSELEAMKSFIDVLPELAARRINNIWCDSKCSANYVVGLKSDSDIDYFKFQFEDAVLSETGGHNGIMFQLGEQPFVGDILTSLDPEWREFGSL